MDGAGQALLAELAADRVETTGVRRCLGTQTRTALILSGESGERSIIEWRDPALCLPPDHVPIEMIQSCRVLHADLFFPETSVRSAAKARESGLLVSVDLDRPGPLASELIELSHLCVVSERFPSLLTGGAAHVLFDTACGFKCQCARGRVEQRGRRRRWGAARCRGGGAGCSAGGSAGSGASHHGDGLPW